MMKNIICSFILLLLVIATSAKFLALQKLMLKMKLHNRMRHRRALNKRDVYHVFQSDLINEEEDNQDTEIHYQQYPDGSDQVAGDSSSYDLLVKLQPKSLRQERSMDEQSRKAQYTTVTINENAVFFQLSGDDGESGLHRSNRGSFESISFNDIVTDSDNLELNQCCQRINKLYDGDDNNKCFDLEGNESTWSLCSEDHNVVVEFRTNLIERVTGKTPQNEVSEDDNEWNWNLQQDWPYLCSNGFSQSPINIDQAVGEGSSCTDYDLKWQLGKALTPKAVYENSEVNILGDFGSIVFSHKQKHGLKDEEYFATRVTFKTPSEHYLDNHKLDGEILVQTQSRNGNTLVLSFLVEIADLDKPNEFVSQATQQWPTSEDSEDEDLEAIDLDLIVPGGAKHSFNKSFYTYYGSLTVPPCTEGIRRVVFTNTVKVQESQWNLIKLSSYNNEINTRGNSKELSEINGREIRIHKDTQTECAGYINYPFDIKSALNVDDQIENENGFVKAVHKKISKVYHTTSQPILTNAQVGNVQVLEVDPSQLDEDTLNSLQDGEILNQ